MFFLIFVSNSLIIPLHLISISLPTNAALGNLLRLAHAQVNTLPHTPTHSHTLPHTPTHIHTHTHTHTHTHDKGLPTVTLCHGPAALLSTGVDGDFAYEGYKTFCFTDKTDAMTPKIGYLPGPMPWACQGTIEEKGMKVHAHASTHAHTRNM